MKELKYFILIIKGYSKDMYTLSPEEKYHLHILSVAQKMNFTPIVFICKGKDIIENDPDFDKTIQVIEYRNVFRFLYKIIPFLIKHQKVIYANSFEWESALIPFLSRKVIFMSHAQQKRNSKIKQLIQNFFYKLFFRIRLINDSEKNFLKIEGMDEKKLFVVPLVPSQNIFNLKNTEGRKDIVYLGNAAPIKNISTILKALDLVLKTKPDIKLHFIGNVPDNSTQETAKELGIIDSIIFHGYMKQDENLNNLLNKTLISINSSINEGQCLGVYDTALSGNVLCLPKIMSFTGVFENKALFHDVFDYEKLAENILFYLNNPDIIEKYQTTCIDMIKKDYSKELIEEKLSALITL